jgi:hypothetical protein
MQGEPPALAALPHDQGGAPIPWGTKLSDAIPRYDAFDENRFNRAISAGRCWSCGERLGATVHALRASIVSAAEATVRLVPEPPSHPACASYFARNPPPGSRIGSLPVLAIWIGRNPEFVSAKPSELGRPRLCFMLTEPSEVYWLAKGTAASRNEVEAEIARVTAEIASTAAAAGLPPERLADQVKQLQRWLP